MMLHTHNTVCGGSNTGKPRNTNPRNKQPARAKPHKKLATVAALVLVVLFSSAPTARALDQETIRRRDLIIDLGDGLTTDAQLTIPRAGDGPFPGVLIIHGSGSTDMDGYIPAGLTGTDAPVRHYLLLAEYLTERGFAVLRYNKRGVGLTGVTLDPDLVGNTTVQDLIQDADTALKVLMQQSEVNPSDVTLIGRSEGAVIAPHVSIMNPAVKNVVLMGSSAHNLYDIIYYQSVERQAYIFEAIDADGDGLTSPEEVLTLNPLLVNQLVKNTTGEWKWRPGFDADGDGFLNFTGELQPSYKARFDYLNQTELQGPWYQSHFALEPTMDIISDVPASVLILHGEMDQQAPVSEVFLLEQELTGSLHFDHTLITYPGLGHTFSPVDRWVQFYGPPEEYVLRDMAEWMKSPERNLYRNFSELGIDVATLEDRVSELESQVGTARGMTSFALIGAVVALSAAAFIALKSRQESPEPEDAPTA